MLNEHVKTKQNNKKQIKKRYSQVHQLFPIETKK